jgi:8-oxo-dGTP diphosphatase
MGGDRSDMRVHPSRMAAAVRALRTMSVAISCSADAGREMPTTIDKGGRTARQAYFDDSRAPTPTVVAPFVFVAVRRPSGQLLLVRRRDSGVWELPGGRVDIGESAQAAAIRETAEEAGLVIRITGLVGLYTRPSQIVRGADGVVRQQFAVVLRGEQVGQSDPRADGIETDSVAWMAHDELADLEIEPATRIRITDALHEDGPHLF